MGYDLHLHAKHGNRVFDFGDWRQTRCPLFRDFGLKFECEGDPIKSTRESVYGEVEYWRPRDFAEVRRWLTEQSTHDSYVTDEFKDLATALVLMEFDESLYFYSSW